MAPLDWDHLMEVDVESLDPSEMNSMVENLSEYEPESDLEPAKLQRLFEVARSIMLVKTVQAEVAEEELTKEAESKGKAGAKESELKLKITELETELKSLKRFPDSGASGQSRDTRYLREEITDLEAQVELLQKEKQARERELAEERRAGERLETRAQDAEKELREVKHDNDQLREDIRDYQRQLETQQQNILMKQGDDREVRDRITQKNRDLINALDEIQRLTDYNDELTKQNENMQAKVKEAIEQMNKTTDEFLKLKMVVSSSDTVVDNLRRENEMLHGQVEELMEQVKSKADADDEIMVKVNDKVEEWKTVLADKDQRIMEARDTIMQLRDQLIAANMDSEKHSVSALTKAVEERDRQIEQLQMKVNLAVGDIENNTALMEDVRNAMARTGKTPEDRQHQKILTLQSTLKVHEDNIKDAETRALEAEDAARDKDRALSEALERMRQYETGEYGLAEAVAEIKEYKMQVNVRDRQIEDLTQFINKCEMKINDMCDENEDLRDRLGLDPQEVIDLSEYRRKKGAQQQEDRALNQVLQKEVERLEEERIELKKTIRKLAQQTGQRAVALGLTADDMMAIDNFTEELKHKHQGPSESTKRIKSDAEKDELKLRYDQLDKDLEKKESKIDKMSQENAELKAKIKQVEEENRQFEQGLREVNQALKEHGTTAESADGQYLQCPTLDRMLAAIEAKNMFGRYDTTLHLKAQNDNLLGRNSELRSELREVRHEANKAKVDLDKAVTKSEKLQGEITALRKAGAGGYFHAMPLPEGIAVTSADVISSLNEHLIQVLQEVSLKEDLLAKMETSLDNYRRKFAVMRHQQGLMYQEYVEEKKHWEEEKEKLEVELKNVLGKAEDDKVRLLEFDRLLSTLAQDDVEVRRRLSDMTRKITVLRVNEKALARRYNALQDIETNMRKENNKLKNEIIQMETAVSERLGYLQRYKDMAAFKIAAIQKALDDSVPAADLEHANKQYTELTEKYRDMLEKGNSLVARTEAYEGYEAEVKRLHQENAFLKGELSVEKEKLHTMEAAIENMKKQGLMGTQEFTDRDVISISKKLTTLEMKELNERQRAEHASQMYEQQKAQLRQLEDRNFELEQKFSEATRLNLEAQKVERELRDELASCVTKAISDADRKRIDELEKSEASLKLEISKLKDIAEVASTQARALDAHQTSRDKEVTSLRQQLLDIQAQSDEKTVIGKLHRHIVQMQVSEGTAVRKLEEANKKISKMEAQLLRTEHKLDERDQSIYHNRLESRNKTKHLKRTIQDLRRKYAGSVPLPRQEKFAESMLKLQEDKRKIEQDLRDTNEERLRVEDKLAELELQHQGLQDLIVTLKDGKGAQKVAEWHGKMEALRLEELKHKRQIDRLKQQISYLEGVIKKHEKEVVALEEENVRMAREYEERQLDWEQREVELERIIVNMERQQAEIAGAASQFEEAVGALPDPSWPVATQLEHAVATIKKNVKLILDTKAEAQVSKKRLEEYETELKDAERNVTARDKIITELRLRMPASAERDQMILQATAAAAGSTMKEEDYEGKQAVRVAQSTVSSLQARIAQKEETINKYQDLLKQAREDMQAMNKRHEEELKLMQEKLHTTSDKAFSKFKEAAMEMIAKPQTALPSNKQLARLNELEDMVAEQDNAMAVMTDKLKNSREEVQGWRNRYEDLVKAHAREKESMVEAHQKQINSVKQLEQDSKEEVHQVQQELKVIQDELEIQKEANSRAPTTTMKSLVERLRNQLALKEKQHQALSKALMELRADMVTQAQQAVKANADEAMAEANVQKVVNKHTKELQDQVEDLQGQVTRLKKDLKRRKDKEGTFNTELDETREELNKREKQVKKLKEDKSRLEGEVEELEKKVERMSTMRGQKGVTDGMQHELEELRRKNRLMQEELKRTKHQAEKPYEQQPGKEGKDEKKGEEAVVRWEEGKKWQKIVDRLKARLKEKETEVEKLQKANEMAKNGLERANREKDNLETKLRQLSKGGPSGGALVKKEAWTTGAAPPSRFAGHDVEELKRRNYELEEEVTGLKRQLTLSRDAAYEEVQLRNKFLAEKLEELEQHVAGRAMAAGQQQGSGPFSVSSDAYKELAEKEAKLQKDFIKISEENIELRFEAEQAKRDIPRLKERIEDLQKYVEVLKQEKEHLMEQMGHSARSLGSSLGSTGGSNVRRIGESGKTTRELEKTIALLKKVVERTQHENEQLKKAPGVVSSDHLQVLQMENQGLKNQLDELRQKVGASLTDRYNATQRGTVKIMADHEKLRKDFNKEVESNEKLRVSLHQMEGSRNALQKELEETKNKLEIEEAKRPSLGSMDSKGWKSVVVTRMYEEKLRGLEEEVEKKNKVIGDVKVLLREAAEREQNLIHDNQDLQQKVAVLERYPGGAQHVTDTNLMRDFQLARLTIARLESEKKELLNDLKVLRQQTNAAAGTPNDVGDDEILAKMRSYDKLMAENVDLRTQVKAHELEKVQLSREVEKLRKELGNFGPDFFEEIEDLKFNYQEAVQKNVQYEEQLTQLSKQFGVAVKVPGL